MGNTGFRGELRAALLLLLGLGAGLGAGLPLAALLVPQAQLAAGITPCPARAAGQPCLLCGMTTATYALAHGDFAAARTAHHAALPLVGGSWVTVIFILAKAWRRRRARPGYSRFDGGVLCRSSV